MAAKEEGLEKKEIKTYLKMVKSKLKKEGFKVNNLKINKYDFIIATKKEFKSKSLANDVNVFAVVGGSDKISKEIIEDYSKRSMAYALEQNEGLPSEVQSGVVSFALLTSFEIDDEAREWVEDRPDQNFTPFEMPIITDLKKNEVYYYDKTPVWGEIYNDFFKDFIKNHF
jgi:hypothetical protein